MELKVIETDDLSVSGDRTPKSVSKLKRKGKQNEVKSNKNNYSKFQVPFHEIIDLDMDEDRKDVVFTDGKVESNKKMQGVILMGVSLGSGSSTKSDSKTDVHVAPAHFPKGFTPGSNNFFNLDDYVSNDDCSALQAHFDNNDLPTGIEASIPLLPELVDMKKKTPVDPAVQSVQSVSAYFNAMGQSNCEEIPEQNMSSSYTSFGSGYHFSNNFKTQVSTSTSTFPLIAMDSVNPLGVDTPTFRLHKLHMKNHLDLNDAYASPDSGDL
ncbi:Ubiquitin-conjugating enzyme, E2 [Artemisia annua]|uniref:Ubiquitin-conjugating enzyme, E2 n=1 Tax=Artemisia annua TaxID=35608 RepID=A0A2U1NRY7_ARTAN|nr:Ubiquitin-conjugating enzyme, E2 [Artemisia annua]